MLAKRGELEAEMCSQLDRHDAKEFAGNQRVSRCRFSIQFGWDFNLQSIFPGSKVLSRQRVEQSTLDVLEAMQPIDR